MGRTMPVDEMFDILPQDAAWGHEMAHDADGLDLHYVRRGHGSPMVLLLHGWPGFWYDWRRVLPHLAQFTSVVALDLRGFGFSAKPDWPVHAAYSPEQGFSKVAVKVNTPRGGPLLDEKQSGDVFSRCS